MNDDQLYEIHAQICQSLANPTRLKLIDCLRGGERRVIDISIQLDIPQATISRHLAVMRQFGVVQSRREAQSVYYRLGNEKITTAYDTMHQFAMDYLRNNIKIFQAVKG